MNHQPFVPDDFVAPTALDGPGFRLEPLGPEHNERDHAAWMASIEHIHATPGFPWEGWPSPMPIEANLGDLEMHARDFRDRSGFTYSVLDGDGVIGCVYIYPSDEADAHVKSWVTADRAELDEPLWRTVSDWLADDWPFETIDYAPR